MNAATRFGLQKLTLLDYPGMVACTVFLHGCNFRCPFCHNASLVVLPPDLDSTISFDELKEFFSKRSRILDGVCVTGGEPLLHKDLPELLDAVKAAGLKVKLDTNGSFPDRLKKIVKAGLVDAAAMDVKNTPEQYDRTAGVDGMYERAAESMAFLLTNPLEYCEFRTTVVKQYHTVDDLIKIARGLTGAKHYFLQKFVDSGDLLGAGLSAMSDADMRNALNGVREFVPNAQIRGI